MPESPSRSITCRICGNECLLEHCMVDEQGRAVHEKCYVAKIVPQANGLPAASQPEWILAYQAAIREREPAKRSQRITEAYRAILDRIEDTRTNHVDGEQQFTNDALLALRMLQRMDGTTNSAA